GRAVVHWFAAAQALDAVAERATAAEARGASAAARTCRARLAENSRIAGLSRRRRVRLIPPIFRRPATNAQGLRGARRPGYVFQSARLLLSGLRQRRPRHRLRRRGGRGNRSIHGAVAL